MKLVLIQNNICNEIVYYRNRKCIAPRANGKSCIPDSDCASGHCCGVWPFKRCRDCCQDSHCTSDKFCMSRTCSNCLELNKSGCTSDSHCCNGGTCCGEKKLFGGYITKGTCIGSPFLCCAQQGNPCSSSTLAPENMKCCIGSCQQDFLGNYICI